MFKTKLAYAQAKLLKIQTRIEGMVAENQRCVTAGYEPAFPQSSFQECEKEIQYWIDYLGKLIEDESELVQLVQDLADCCGTTLDKTCFKQKLTEVLNG